MQGVNFGNSEFRKRKVLTILFFVALVLYFIYNIMGGDRGIIALFKLNKQHIKLEKEVKTLNSEKAVLQDRVSRLKSDSLDLDLLEEQVRENLGYAKGNETVYVDEGIQN
jgi:cell division protein FtsB